MVRMHSIASSRLVSSSGGFRDRPSCLSTGRRSSVFSAHSGLFSAHSGLSELPAAHPWCGSYFSFLSEPSWGLFSAHSGLFSAHLGLFSAHSGLCSAHSGLVSKRRAPLAAYRRRVGLVRCMESRPLRIASGSASCAHVHVRSMECA
jgi:hypothetical protein